MRAWLSIEDAVGRLDFRASTEIGNNTIVISLGPDMGFAISTRGIRKVRTRPHERGMLTCALSSRSSPKMIFYPPWFRSRASLKCTYPADRTIASPRSSKMSDRERGFRPRPAMGRRTQNVLQLGRRHPQNLPDGDVHRECLLRACKADDW